MVPESGGGVMCRKKLSTLLLALSFSLPFVLSVQAEEMYTISESELTQLEMNLRTLKEHSEKKQKLLNEQQVQLTEASKQLETVQKELTASKSLNAQTQKSLERANQSLTVLEQEAKQKIKIKTRQRNLWILISGGLLYAYINK
jgi:septal ring factor EnvC (AmiA/AmiB activator)